MNRWIVFAVQTPIYFLAAVLLLFGAVGLCLVHLGVYVQERATPGGYGMWEQIFDEIIGVNRGA